MVEKLKQTILSGEFNSAKEYFISVSEDKIEDMLVGFAYDTEDINVYLFLLNMIFETESAYLHAVASTIMTVGFSHVSGAYYIAFRHMLRAVELEPNDYSYKEGLLFFYSVPDKILGEEEAMKIAKEILRVNPNSESAKLIIK